jgi:ubiquinone/menaquinone biosynthesis C-methylase UbiE
MDYDKTNLPNVYDAGRALTSNAQAALFDATSRGISKSQVRRILDVGCGTGRFSSPLALHFDAEVIAVDPSEKMLAAARQKPMLRVRYVRAAAEALPLPDGFFDMSFLSMVLHHFSDPMRAVQECRRVLRRGGFVFLRTATTDQMHECPYVPFFKRSAAVLSDLNKSVASTKSIFFGAGFRLVRHEIVRNEAAPNWAAYADRIAYRAIAALQQLSQQEFDEGLEALHRFAAARALSGPVVEPIDVFVFRSSR